jgi:hypothetical protein
MFDLLYLGILILLGLMLGTYIKFSVYGIPGKLNIILTLLTPYLSLKIAFMSMSEIKTKPMKALKNFVSTFLNYPLIITIISEITLEALADIIVKTKVERAVTKEPLEGDPSNSFKVLKETIKETTENVKKINLSSRLGYKVS